MFWTPQSDDSVVVYGEDEDDAVVWGDLRELYGDPADYGDYPEGVNEPCEECGCYPCHSRCGEKTPPSDDGDGYAAGGHMDYYHAQYDE